MNTAATLMITNMLIEIGIPGLYSLWTRAFNDSALSQYIELPAGELTRGEYRSYLDMLFFLTVAFWAFRDSEEISKLYVKDLSSAAKMSKSTNFILQCFAAKLPSIMLLIILAHYDVDSIGRDSSTSAVFAGEEVLDFVELMMMAKPKSRDTVLRALVVMAYQFQYQGLDPLECCTARYVREILEFLTGKPISNCSSRLYSKHGWTPHINRFAMQQ